MRGMKITAYNPRIVFRQSGTTVESRTDAQQPKIQPAPPRKREKSEIEFTYNDLDAAVQVVMGVHNAGGTACDSDQLAAQMKMEASGGGFRNRILSAKTYGLVSYERGGRISLTDLGRDIIDPTKERQAKVDAFLAVELHQRVFDEFKGSPLPPQAALQRAIEALGISAKVSDKARQVLMRSAKQAGFFDAAAERLVRPSIKPQAGEQAPGEDGGGGGARGGQNGGGGDGGGGEHPLLRGLMQTLPKQGTEWPSSDRLNWLRMAESIFKMVYQSKGEQIEILIEPKQPTGGQARPQSQ